MLDQEILKKTRIHPVDIPQRVLCRVTRGNSQAQCRVSDGKSEVDQQDSLIGFLGQCDGHIAGNRRNAGSSLGADKDEQLSECSFLLPGVFSRRVVVARARASATAPCSSGKKQVLASACTHQADRKFLIGLL